jgi:thiosulfate/3-mercaptopyruvate sulfurtransferase
MAHSPLILVDELAGLLATPEADPPGRPVVLDVRYRMSGPSGRREFERAHIPGATFVDLNTELATIRPDGAGGRHPMPTVATFTAAMRSAGVTMSRQVVAYDDWASLPASRLWWMLRHLGFRDVRVLDGGLSSWIAAGQPTESRPCTPGLGDFSPSVPGVGRILDAADARKYAGQHLLLDARPADRFHGENETIDPVAGHIPGAVSAPALANVDSRGRFLPADELAGRLQRLETVDGTLEARAALGATGTPDARTSITSRTASGARTVGTYCGSGVQATHLALALSVAGICDDVDVYIGSWSDWITDPARPVEG